MNLIGRQLKESFIKEVAENNKRLENRFDTIIGENNQVLKDNKSYTEAVKNSLASSTNNQISQPEGGVDFREIIRQEKNEQLAEETEKRSRACNFIIHGVAENINCDTKQREEDYVTTLITTLGLNMSYKSLYRLGKKVISDNQHKRPIKVILNNEVDKDRLMASLKSLKGLDDYKGISVTDDYTIQERNLIKLWSEKAKKANEDEPIDSKFIWRVRGNSKNGFGLKKLPMRNTHL